MGNTIAVAVWPGDAPWVAVLREYLAWRKLPVTLTTPTPDSTLLVWEAAHDVPTGYTGEVLQLGEALTLNTQHPTLSTPLRLDQLYAHLLPLLERQGPRLPHGYRLDPVQRVLRHETGAESPPLTEKEWDMLAFLAASPHSVSRETLLTHVWRYDPTADTHTLETHLYRLRQKLATLTTPALSVQNGPEGYCLG
jgi:hypothetical protein